MKKALPDVSISDDDLLTDDRYSSLLTPEQRLAVYNETIKQFKTKPKQRKIQERPSLFEGRQYRNICKSLRFYV